MQGYLRQRSRGKWEITIDTGRDPSTDKRLRHFETIIGGKKERIASDLMIQLLGRKCSL